MAMREISADSVELVPADQILAAPMSRRMQDVFLYLGQNRGLLTKYLSAVIDIHREGGQAISPQQALAYGANVLAGLESRVSPLVSDFSSSSHGRHIRRLERLGEDMSEEGEISLSNLAGQFGARVHSLIEASYRGELAGKNAQLGLDTSEDQLTFKDCVTPDGRVREDILQAIDVCRRNVVAALNNTEGTWDAIHYGEELYHLLTPLLGEGVKAIYKYRHTNPSLVAPTLANLATMLLFTQTPEYQESRMPTFTEIKVLFEAYGGRADAFVVTGKDGKPLTETEKIYIEALTHDKDFRKRNITIGRVLRALGQRFGGRFEGIILDIKHEVGDNYAAKRGELITAEALVAGPLFPHVTQVTDYVTKTNIDDGVLHGDFIRASDPLTRASVLGARLQYVTRHNLKGPTEFVVAPTLYQQQEHFETNIVQRMPGAVRQAELRAMLDVLVADVVEKWDALKGQTRKRIYSVRKPAAEQDFLFPPGPTMADVIEAHRTFLDKNQIFEVIRTPDGRPTILLHLSKLLDYRKVHVKPEKRPDETFTETTGGMMRCLLHADGTASLGVQDGGFFCHGCGAHGVVAMGEHKFEGRVGSRRRSRRSGKIETLSEDLHELEPDIEHLAIMFAAQELFRKTFESSKGKGARAYLTGRGISMEAAHEFGVGYANHTKGDYLAYFASKGFTEEQLLKYGLLSKPKKGGESYPALNGRLTFPLALKNREVTSFYGRSINPDINPKLKHRLLSIKRVGLEHGMAHQAVLEQNPKQVTIVEGVFDAMARWMTGDKNVIAVISATNYLLAELVARKTKRICLGFDYDENASGQKGTLRVARRLKELDFLEEGELINETFRYHLAHPEDGRLKDWNEILLAHPGMQAEFIS